VTWPPKYKRGSGLTEATALVFVLLFTLASGILLGYLLGYYMAKGSVP
jgi:hypothetical protein